VIVVVCADTVEVGDESDGAVVASESDGSVDGEVSAVVFVGLESDVAALSDADPSEVSSAIATPWPVAIAAPKPMVTAPAPSQFR
jgi:hypothetical protein